MNAIAAVNLVDVHAIAMIAFPIGVFAFLLATKRCRPPTLAVAGWTLLCGGVTAFLCAPRLCTEASPRLQVVIPAACLWFVALFVNDKNARYPAITVCCIVFFIFSQQYELWTRSPEWTSAPARKNRMNEHYNRIMVSNAEDALLLAGATDEGNYPPMWFAELPVEKRNRQGDVLELRPCWPQCEWTRCWHTGITGLYRRQVLAQRDYWYLGGPLKDAAGRVVVKDRAANGMPTTGPGGG